MAVLLTTSYCFAEDLRPLIRDAEEKYSIPSGLLSAIAEVESGYNPYALNIAGQSIFAGSREEAADIVYHYLDRGHKNIDLGIMQVNFHWHGKNFRDIEEMLSPEYNIAYAAKLLCSLYRQHGSWSKAVRHYHSAKAEYHVKYSRKVLAIWLGGN